MKRVQDAVEKTKRVKVVLAQLDSVIPQLMAQHYTWTALPLYFVSKDCRQIVSQYWEQIIPDCPITDVDESVLRTMVYSDDRNYLVKPSELPEVVNSTSPLSKLWSAFKFNDAAFAWKLCCREFSDHIKMGAISSTILLCVILQNQVSSLSELLKLLSWRNLSRQHYQKEPRVKRLPLECLVWIREHYAEWSELFPGPLHFRKLLDEHADPQLIELYEAAQTPYEIECLQYFECKPPMPTVRPSQNVRRWLLFQPERFDAKFTSLCTTGPNYKNLTIEMIKPQLVKVGDPKNAMHCEIIFPTVNSKTPLRWRYWEAVRSGIPTENLFEQDPDIDDDDIPFDIYLDDDKVNATHLLWAISEADASVISEADLCPLTPKFFGRPWNEREVAVEWFLRMFNGKTRVITNLFNTIYSHLTDDEEFEMP